MKHYMAGLLAHASEITYFLAPYINSYKRFMAGTFAPTRAIWSFDNRTAGYRLCGADSKAVRVECRVGGADLNPYLAFAALHRRRASRASRRRWSSSRFFPAMPTTPVARSCAKFRRRCARRPTLLDGSKFLRSAFGDEVIDHYVHTGQVGAVRI